MLFFYLFVIFNKFLTSLKLLFLVKSYIFIYAKRYQVVLRVSEYLSPLLMHYIEGINLLSP